MEYFKNFKVLINITVPVAKLNYSSDRGQNDQVYCSSQKKHKQNSCFHIMCIIGIIITNNNKENNASRLDIAFFSRRQGFHLIIIYIYSEGVQSFQTVPH